MTESDKSKFPYIRTSILLLVVYFIETGLINMFVPAYLGEELKIAVIATALATAGVIAFQTDRSKFAQAMMYIGVVATLITCGSTLVKSFIWLIAILP